MVPAQVEAMVGQQIKGTILGMMVALGASKYAYQPEEISQITINGNKELWLYFKAVIMFKLK